jgi:ribosomal protein L37AE/L43A
MALYAEPHTAPAKAQFFRSNSCAQCGVKIVAPEWSEHVSDRCVRHLWSCEACGYQFETSVFFPVR